MTHLQNVSVMQTLNYTELIYVFIAKIKKRYLETHSDILSLSIVILNKKNVLVRE